MYKNFDHLIIGGGIFGLTTAIELANRQYKVALLEASQIPNPLAASTDISKKVRMEYGADRYYGEMAKVCIERWKEWNDFFGEALYHETGVLMITPESFDHPRQQFERDSHRVVSALGFSPVKLNREELKKRFPAVNTSIYKEGYFNPDGGYVDAVLVLETLANHARKIGVDIFENEVVEQLHVEKGQLSRVSTQSGNTFHCDMAIVAAGAHTPYLVPDLAPFLKPTGHPIFWLKPFDPKPFTVPNFAGFVADISNAGWYGFPYNSKAGVLKVGRHAAGLEIHPDQEDRYVTEREIIELRSFLRRTFPDLAQAPMVYTRRCLYTDALDGHFWIDEHPEIKGLAVSSGGSGHAMKMAPLIGEITADMVEGKKHRFGERFRWRQLDANNMGFEAARAK